MTWYAVFLQLILCDFFSMTRTVHQLFEIQEGYRDEENILG